MKVLAVNTARDSDNRIHDSEIAAEYGFSGALVPGVTIYGYMASAVIERLGFVWLDRGAMDVRFFQPFYEGDEVSVDVTDVNDGKLKADATRAAATAWLADEAIPADYPGEGSLQRQDASHESMRPGTLLAPLSKTLDLSQQGLSAPLDAFIGSERLAHPAIILGLANELLMHNYVLGPWIHTSSEVRNASAARDGDHIQVRGKIIDAYERKEHEFLVVDVAILGNGSLLSRIRHTAIWKPRK